MESLIPQWIKDIETLLSLFGFFLTFIVFRSVSEVKASFQRKARLPEVLNDLTKYGSELSRLLAVNPVNDKSCDMQIKSAASLLRLAKRHLPSGERKEIKIIVKKLSRENGNLWDSYTQIQVAICVINQACKSAKWE